MFLDTAFLGPLVTLSLIAVALGMDAFSLGLSIGVRGIEDGKAHLICFIVGAFHFFMPVAGIGVGHLLSQVIGTFTVYVGGALLLAIGLNMVYAGFKGEKVAVSDNRSLSLLKMVLLAFSVSVDSFSAGFSFGLFSFNVLFVASLLGFTGGALAGAGLVIGRFANKWLADYGELVGGTILVAFGLKFLL